MKKRKTSIIILFFMLFIISGCFVSPISALNNDIKNRDEFSWKVKMDGVNMSLYPGAVISEKQKINIIVIAKTDSNIQLHVELENGTTHSFSILDYFDDVFEDKHFYLFGMLILPTNESYYDPLDEYFENEDFDVIHTGGSFTLTYNNHTIKYDNKGILTSYIFDSTTLSVDVKMVTDAPLIVPLTVGGIIIITIALVFLGRKIRNIQRKRIQLRGRYQEEVVIERKVDGEIKKERVRYISIPITSMIVSNQAILQMLFSVFSFIALLFMFYANYFITTKPMTEFYFGFEMFENHRDMIDWEFLSWGSLRMGKNIEGYVVAILIILVAVMWIIKTVFSAERRKAFKYIISVFLCSSGVLLIVTTRKGVTAYQQRLSEGLTENVSELFIVTYWLETIFFFTLLIIAILIAIEIGKSEQKRLVLNAVWIIIGLAIIITACVFTIRSMEIIFDYYIIGATELNPETYLPEFLPAVILPALARIIILVSSVIGMIKLQKKKSLRIFVLGFESIGFVLFFTMIGREALNILYNFLYPTGELDPITSSRIIAKRGLNLNAMDIINQSLFWILVIAGFYAIAKTAVFDDLRHRYSELKKLKKVMEVLPPPKPAIEHIFCPNCGEKISIDSTECEHCGAAIEIDDPRKISTAKKKNAKKEKKKGKESKKKTKEKEQKVRERDRNE